MLSASTRVRGESSMRRRVASMPFSSGMATSITTTSGFSFWASSTASRPLPASPAISISGCAARIIRKPWRTSAWSSAKRILIMFFHGSGDVDGDASAGCGGDGAIAACAAGAGAHAGEAHAGVVGRGLGEAAAVIGNGQTDVPIFGAEKNCDTRCVGVSRNVGQGLLHDAEQVRLRFIRQAAVEMRAVIDADARPLAKSL